MSHIFVGDMGTVDKEVLDRLQQLGDDFWVIAATSVEREIDWLVIRTMPNGHSAIIVTELKRYNEPIRGISQDSTWERQTIDGSWHPMNGHNDRNPYWQAVNTANTLKQWLWNHQDLIRDNASRENEDQFGVWPLLLILSPEGVRHQLPVRPTSRYGAWVFDLDRWVNMLESWKPRKGVAFTDKDMTRLVGVLGLTEVKNTTPHEAAPKTLPTYEQLVERVENLEKRVSRTTFGGALP